MRNIKLSLKIITSEENKIIGWAGNILMIKLNKDYISDDHYLINFLSITTGVSMNNIGIVSRKKNIYEFDLKVKYSESLDILFN